MNEAGKVIVQSIHTLVGRQVGSCSPNPECIYGFDVHRQTCCALTEYTLQAKCLKIPLYCFALLPPHSCGHILGTVTALSGWITPICHLVKGKKATMLVFKKSQVYSSKLEEVTFLYYKTLGVLGIWAQKNNFSKLCYWSKIWRG